MRYSRRISAVLALAVAGCSTVPDLPNEPRVTLDEIIITVECEVFQAVAYVQNEDRIYAGTDPEEHWLNDWAAKVSFDLKTEILSSITPSLTLAAPLTPGTLTLTVGGSRTDENEAFGKFEYSFNLAALSECKPKRTRSLLTGDVGIQEWLSRVGRAMDATENKPNSISHDAEFIITVTGNGGVTIANVSAGEATLGGTLGGRGERKDTHKLTIALTPISPQDLPKVQGPARRTKQVGPATERRLDRELDERRVERLEDALDEEAEDCPAFSLVCLR